jgi:muramoyltetrapeptide carboxypeptidase
MNRQQFLSTILPITFGGFLSKKLFAGNDPFIQPFRYKTPANLKPGALIGITCPGSPLDIKDAANCLNALQSWGFKVNLGHTVGSHWERFGGTDDERAAELQQFLDDENMQAILFGRGGYGVMRILDKLNWEKFATNPKWLIGYSDITAIHCHINSFYGIPTIHADMANGFDVLPDAASVSLYNVLTGVPISCPVAGSCYNKTGMVQGELVGGNLSLIYAMQSSRSELHTDGKILMLEDVGEYKYTIDRMLVSLKRSGKLSRLAALAVGSFTAIKEEQQAKFNLSLEELVLEKVNEYSYPVCFNFPAGHQKENLAFKLGVKYNLNIMKEESCISELVPGNGLPGIFSDPVAEITTDTIPGRSIH